jgi:hypothetical protein
MERISDVLSEIRSIVEKTGLASPDDPKLAG